MNYLVTYVVGHVGNHGAIVTVKRQAHVREDVLDHFCKQVESQNGCISKIQTF